jgi:hypothetical protein
MTFDPSKPVQTRDGRKARVLCTDFKIIPSDIRILSIIKEEKYADYLIILFHNGRKDIDVESEDDLVNVTEGD